MLLEATSYGFYNMCNWILRDKLVIKITAGLLDAAFDGHTFTWSNNRTGSAAIKARLDRALITPNWNSLFPAFHVQHLSREKGQPPVRTRKLQEGEEPTRDGDGVQFCGGSVRGGDIPGTVRYMISSSSASSPGRSNPQLAKMGKTHGMRAARKLKNHRRAQRWADKAYKKSHLDNEWKKLFQDSSHAKGNVLEKIGIEAKQPNSAIRKCARVQLIKNGKKIAAFVPNDGCLKYIEENDEVLIGGFGRKGHAVGDIPGIRFKVVKVSGVSLLALFKEKKDILFLDQFVRELYKASGRMETGRAINSIPLLLPKLISKRVKLLDMYENIVAMGIVMSTDPTKIVMGRSIGQDFCEIAVLLANKPESPLFIKDDNRKTMKDAIGSHILWFLQYVQLDSKRQVGDQD
ncbi:hypothetical protein Taro_034019 [Colocasia esculenta]|uniref:Transposase Tnp1/En/Spm-like domain-containing protein n=1 Tax=Colocasia esculenta TaxID=4460 RepID=A0A843W2Y0_COLES|nr:hypothetical protein [Colocasia esculenta]